MKTEIPNPAGASSSRQEIVGTRLVPPALLLCAAALLSACGAGGDSAGDDGSARMLRATPLASGTTTVELATGDLPPAAAVQLAQPSFHVAPVLLDTPEDDAHGQSARQPAHQQAVPNEFQSLPTRRLTLQDLQQRHAVVMLGLTPAQAAAPTLSRTVVTTYTPAQIRAAYGLPALPATGAKLTAMQAAQLGAGQTVYIVDARDDPNAAAELAAFNQKFGLPACTTKAVAASASLPLAAASATSCELSVVYSTPGGAMTSARPNYDAGWATEIALDVQWVHATAPLARIVLIETADSSYDALLGGVRLANAMGPGSVSMSFGGAESRDTMAADPTFAQTNMTYLAATGDSGTGVLWPSVSPHVLAVGGTTLSYSGSGPRAETAWAGTGGGVSQFTPLPSYQSNAVPGMGTPAYRTVADVAFNADPASGQYVAVMTPGGGITASWLSVGGTSLATPQWAGLIAIANALRAQGGKGVLGAPHAVLYGQIATAPATYASNFADILQGSDGSCASCSARTAYDPLTGLGTPNAASLLGTLSGATILTPPAVVSASISGTAGTPLSFQVACTAADAVTYALSGAPSGMAISAAGTVTWAAPVVGSYTVTVTATDSKNGLSGSGVYTIAIARQAATPPPPSGPGTTQQTLTGAVGMPLSFSVAIYDSNPVTYTMSGAPDGMTINGAQVSWPSPVLGVYAVTFTSRDLKTGVSGQVLYIIQITNGGPIITAAPMSGVAGQPFRGSFQISDPGVFSTTIAMAGMPLGMMTLTGSDMTLVWNNPTVGNYVVKVTIKDTLGRSAQQSIPIIITAR